MSENPKYSEEDVPDADKVAERADYPDPAFDEVEGNLEAPVADEGEGKDLPPEDPDQLEADEQTDPEESAQPLPPETDRDD